MLLAPPNPDIFRPNLEPPTRSIQLPRKIKKKSDEFVDILDKNRDRLAVLSRKEAKFQGLSHRLIMVTLGDSSGRVCIRKRGPKKRLYPSRLDLMASGHVRSGEAIHDAACRHLSNEAGISPPRMDLVQTIFADERTDNQIISFFSAGKIKQLPETNNPEFGSLMLLDPEELGHLVLEMPELLTPSLVFAWNEKLVFSFS
jgi:isopentenyldiphosphate isomerase